MSARRRLPLAPAEPVPARPGHGTAELAMRLETGRVVLAVVGEEAPVLAFVRALREHGTDACVVIEADSLVREDSSELVARIERLPRDRWVIAAGDLAATRIAATFTVRLGRRHGAASDATDLWLGQSSEVVARALVEALCTAAF